MIPGSHRKLVLSLFQEGTFCGATEPDDKAARLNDAVSTARKAASVGIHHAHTMHGSAPNLSDNPLLFLLSELAAATIKQCVVAIADAD